MTVIAPLRRAGYRVRQFVNALDAYIRPLTPGERAEAQAWLPESAWPLFDAMPRNDQRHSLNVLRSLCAAGHDEPALMQAALLHDVAKSSGGVTLFHRVAVVLLKIVRPDWAARMVQTSPPARNSLRYPFWAHANHPQLGAEMAAAAGCDPLAVMLIRRHQEMGRGAEEPLRGSRGDIDLLLTALRTADDDN
jgi:hypothetical protein